MSECIKVTEVGSVGALLEGSDRERAPIDKGLRRAINIDPRPGDMLFSVTQIDKPKCVRKTVSQKTDCFLSKN